MPLFYTSIAEKYFRYLSEVNRIDVEIDELEYEKYGLTEEEIRIVKGSEG